MQFQKGDKILNRYEVQAVLGGGMGDVYIVQTPEGYPYAIKTFKDQISCPPITPLSLTLG